MFAVLRSSRFWLKWLKSFSHFCILLVCVQQMFNINSSYCLLFLPLWIMSILVIDSIIQKSVSSSPLCAVVWAAVHHLYVTPTPPRHREQMQTGSTLTLLSHFCIVDCYIYPYWGRMLNVYHYQHTHFQIPIEIILSPSQHWQRLAL